MSNTIVSDSDRTLQIKNISYNKFRFGYLVQLEKTYLNNLKFFNFEKKLLIEDMQKWKLWKKAVKNNLDLTNIPKSKKEYHQIKFGQYLKAKLDSTNQATNTSNKQNKPVKQVALNSIDMDQFDSYTDLMDLIDIIKLNKQYL